MRNCNIFITNLIYVTQHLVFLLTKLRRFLFNIFGLFNCFKSFYKNVFKKLHFSSPTYGYVSGYMLEYASGYALRYVSGLVGSCPHDCWIEKATYEVLKLGLGLEIKYLRMNFVDSGITNRWSPSLHKPYRFVGKLFITNLSYVTQHLFCLLIKLR